MKKPGKKELEFAGLRLMDVTPVSLGVGLICGSMEMVIKRNSRIPIAKTREYTTVEDKQDRVTLQVFEGEHKFAKNNHSLGEFEVVGIPEAPKGVETISITFSIDANGVLDVTAKLASTSKGTKIRISKTRRMTEEQITEMV